MSDFPGYLLLSLRIILALFLYGFLGFSIWTIWQDLRKTEQTKSAKQIPPITVEIGLEEARRLSYTSSEIIIGRAPQCDLHIQDETVSSRHGQLYFKFNQWWYEDLGSSNGSLLNQRLVKTPTVLTNGDVLQLGKINFTVSFSE